MKLVKTEEAVGQVLCHDITQIIPGVVKDAVFRKGHIVTAEDIPVLLSVGKEHLYVWEKKEGILHEDEAAAILRDICINDNMSASEPKEGKIEIKAQADGLLKVDTQRLHAVNALGELMIATIHGNFPVKQGDRLAATRVIPLVIEEEKMERAKQTAGEKPLLEILPFGHWRVGIVTTGSEVFKGRIEDAFGPAIRAKLAAYDTEVIGQQIVDDDQESIVRAIGSFVEQGADLVLCTGGMSVDPDDKTPGAIKAFGADIVSYGAPVLPGAMFLVSYYETADASDDTAEQGKVIPILGLPGCVMYAKRTVFDLLLPRILAGERLTAEDISAYGEGGLCLNCPECHFPNCGFGK
ncbi:MAG: molybdopterin-binding protein [Lachnospiraceae bacterium]|nr:molybdopterin-binding protein [Lachnospiraceae bacterium]